MDVRPSRYPPAIRNRNEENVPRQPWTKDPANQNLSLRELPLYTLNMAEELVVKLKHFTRDFLQLSNEQVRAKVLCISKNDLLEDVASNPVFVNFAETVEKTGVLIADTECPSQSRLKNLKITVGAGLGMVEVLQLGDLEGNILIIQVLQDCREGHTGCVCNPTCKKKDVIKPRGKSTYTSSCPKDRGDHAEWQHRSSLKNHGFQEFPEFIREWLNRKSIFVVQSSVACHSGKYEDKERIDGLLGTDTTSWVELQNIHAMFLGTCQTHCDLCGENFDMGEHRDHMVKRHGVRAYMKKRKCGNGRLFELFGLTNPDSYLEPQKIFDIARQRPFSRWKRALLAYDSGDILIVALTLWQVTIDMMRIQELPSTASVLEYMRCILHILKNEPSLTVLKAHDRVWPFQIFRVRNEMGCIEKLPGKVPAYLPGGPNLEIPYPVRNIRQVVNDLANDQYFPKFLHSNIPQKYRWEGRYDPLEIARTTRRSKAHCIIECPNGQDLEGEGLSRYLQRFQSTNEDFEQCFYVLCDSKEQHSTTFCPVLHRLCKVCGTRGHLEEYHKTLTPIELKNVFDFYSPWGLYTCLPVLYQHEEYAEEMKASDCRFGYFGNLDIQDYGPMNAHFPPTEVV